MSILEVENTGDIPQGVVLLLVGPDADTPGPKDQDSLRSVRMYNLASLTSLAKWAVGQKVSSSIFTLHLNETEIVARERGPLISIVPQIGMLNNRHRRNIAHKAASSREV